MTISLLGAPPAVLTAAELAALSVSTPASFEAIPPLLRHEQLDVTLSIDPPFHNYAGGLGTLFVTEESVSFFSPETSTGISIPYPHITLHAISRAPLSTNGTTGGGPCIYCQIDESEGVEGEGEDEDGYASSREALLVPADPASLDRIFDMFSTCAALHPPPSSSSGDGGVFGGLDPSSMVYADAEGNLVGPGMGADGDDDDEAEESSAGRATRQRLESLMDWPITSHSHTNGAVPTEAEEDADDPVVPHVNGAN